VTDVRAFELEMNALIHLFTQYLLHDYVCNSVISVMYGEGLQDQHYKNLPLNTDYGNRTTVAIKNKLVCKYVIL
jgi:hypothetical protein